MSNHVELFHRDRDLFWQLCWVSTSGRCSSSRRYCFPCLSCLKHWNASYCATQRIQIRASTINITKELSSVLPVSSVGLAGGVRRQLLKGCAAEDRSPGAEAGPVEVVDLFTNIWRAGSCKCTTGTPTSRYALLSNKLCASYATVLRCSCSASKICRNLQGPVFRDFVYTPLLSSCATPWGRLMGVVKLTLTICWNPLTNKDLRPFTEGVSRSLDEQVTVCTWSGIRVEAAWVVHIAWTFYGFQWRAQCCTMANAT